MNDREKWRERVRDIRAGGTTWWWWWWWWWYVHLLAIKRPIFSFQIVHPRHFSDVTTLPIFDNFRDNPDSPFCPLSNFSYFGFEVCVCVSYVFFFLGGGGCTENIKQLWFSYQIVYPRLFPMQTILFLSDNFRDCQDGIFSWAWLFVTFWVSKIFPFSSSLDFQKSSTQHFSLSLLTFNSSINLLLAPVSQ